MVLILATIFLNIFTPDTWHKYTDKSPALLHILQSRLPVATTRGSSWHRSLYSYCIIVCNESSNRLITLSSPYWWLHENAVFSHREQKGLSAGPPPTSPISVACSAYIEVTALSSTHWKSATHSLQYMAQSYPWQCGYAWYSSSTVLIPIHINRQCGSAGHKHIGWSTPTSSLQ